MSDCDRDGDQEPLGNRVGIYLICSVLPLSLPLSIYPSIYTSLFLGFYVLESSLVVSSSSMKEILGGKWFTIQKKRIPKKERKEEEGKEEGKEKRESKGRKERNEKEEGKEGKEVKEEEECKEEKERQRERKVSSSFDDIPIPTSTTIPMVDFDIRSSAKVVRQPVKEREEREEIGGGIFASSSISQTNHKNMFTVPHNYITKVNYNFLSLSSPSLCQEVGEKRGLPSVLDSFPPLFQEDASISKNKIRKTRRLTSFDIDISKDQEISHDIQEEGFLSYIYHGIRDGCNSGGSGRGHFPPPPPPPLSLPDPLHLPPSFSKNSKRYLEDEWGSQNNSRLSSQAQLPSIASIANVTNTNTNTYNHRYTWSAPSSYSSYSSCSSSPPSPLLFSQSPMCSAIIAPPCPTYPSSIFKTPSSSFASILESNLPPQLQNYDWQLLYSSAVDGLSIHSLVKAGEHYGNTILVIEDDRGKIFGAFLSLDWGQRGASMKGGWTLDNGKNYYGKGDSFLYSFNSDLNLDNSSQLDLQAQTQGKRDIEDDLEEGIKKDQNQAGIFRMEKKEEAKEEEEEEMKKKGEGKGKKSEKKEENEGEFIIKDNEETANQSETLRQQKKQLPKSWKMYLLRLKEKNEENWKKIKSFLRHSGKRKKSFGSSKEQKKKEKEEREKINQTLREQQKKEINQVFKKYPWTSASENDYFLLSCLDYIAIGGGNDFGIYLCSDLTHGYCGRCQTFQNPPLNFVTADASAVASSSFSTSSSSSTSSSLPSSQDHHPLKGISYLSPGRVVYSYDNSPARFISGTVAAPVSPLNLNLNCVQPATSTIHLEEFPPPLSADLPPKSGHYSKKEEKKEKAEKKEQENEKEVNERAWYNNKSADPKILRENLFAHRCKFRIVNLELFGLVEGQNITMGTPTSRSSVYSDLNQLSQNSAYSRTSSSSLNASSPSPFQTSYLSGGSIHNEDSSDISGKSSKKNNNNSNNNPFTGLANLWATSEESFSDRNNERNFFQDCPTDMLEKRRRERDAKAKAKAKVNAEAKSNIKKESQDKEQQKGAKDQKSSLPPVISIRLNSSD